MTCPPRATWYIAIPFFSSADVHACASTQLLARRTLQRIAGLTLMSVTRIVRANSGCHSRSRTSNYRLLGLARCSRRNRTGASRSRRRDRIPTCTKMHTPSHYLGQLGAPTSLMPAAMRHGDLPPEATESAGVKAVCHHLLSQSAMALPGESDGPGATCKVGSHIEICVEGGPECIIVRPILSPARLLSISILESGQRYFGR